MNKLKHTNKAIMKSFQKQYEPNSRVQVYEWKQIKRILNQSNFKKSQS